MRALLVAMAIALTVVSADAQVRPNRRVPPEAALGGDAAGVSPAEIQRLFDAYVVMQAQQELALSDDQYPSFLNRVRALQDLRRRTEVERTRRMQILRRLTLDTASNENDIRVQLKEFDDFELRTSTEVAKAQEAVSQVLTVRQQARFRLFQEQMERRKVDLLMRARQANRARQQP